MEGKQTSNSIKRIVIKQLFGQFDYALPKAPHEDEGLTEIAILYGDNGSGKTTILNLIFHLLSPADNRRHRNAIAEIPFEYFEVSLDNDTKIIAKRVGGKQVGPFDLEVIEDGFTSIEVGFTPGDSQEFSHRAGEMEFLKFLENLNLSIYFMSADRHIASDLWDSPHEDALERITIDNYRHTGRRVTPDQIQESIRNTALENAIRMASRWISRHAMFGSNVGSQTANTIYTEIISRIAQPSMSEAIEHHENIKGKLTQTLKELSNKNRGYSKFEFTSEFRVDELIGLINTAPNENLPIINNILEPFIDSTQARYDALEEVRFFAETFVNSFNEFYVGKKIMYTMRDGFKIVSDNEIELEPGQLSSGEQQLLLLFCHTLVSRDRPSIFIIDEPELSLNIKWQRMLIKALLEIVQGSDIQFLFATHSMELLAQHFEKVIKLELG